MPRVRVRFRLLKSKKTKIALPGRERCLASIAARRSSSPAPARSPPPAAWPASWRPAARRRYAQQKTVHWLRWVDFVPASDTLLRKELVPEAEKALGIKINLETVNGNDLQPRATAAIQSGAGPDLIMAFNNHDLLYANSVVDLTDLAEDLGKREGGLYKYARSICSDGKMFMRMPWAVIGGMIAYRKSWFDEVGATTFPKTWDELSRGRQEAEGQGPAGRPDARPHLRRCADLHLSATCGRGAARKSRPTARRWPSTPRRRIESVKFMHGLLEGRHGRGRPRLGRHQQQPRLPVADHLGDPERRLDLHRDRCASPSSTRPKRARR